ncbi:MAG TPA: hypothetical protein VFM93_11940, partial [Candidatus Limnocylindria bacterium]|nr:hypothetical protein [Candidatus Limnocylindria bacterium]
ATILVWSGAMAFVTMPELAIYAPAVLLSAAVGEAIWAAMGRGALGGRDGRHGYWILGAAVPGTQLAAYLGLMATVGGGVAWPITLSAGAPVFAAVYALAATVFAIPPSFLRAR